MIAVDRILLHNNLQKISFHALFLQEEIICCSALQMFYKYEFIRLAQRNAKKLNTENLF